MRIVKRLVEAMLDGPVMPADLPALTEPEPLSSAWDTEDLALEYMEGEIGRHDWRRNWKDHKTKHGGNLKSVVQAWLNRYEIDHDPQGLIDFIESGLMQRQGKWL